MLLHASFTTAAISSEVLKRRITCLLPAQNGEWERENTKEMLPHQTPSATVPWPCQIINSVKQALTDIMGQECDDTVLVLCAIS